MLRYAEEEEGRDEARMLPFAVGYCARVCHAATFSVSLCFQALLDVAGGCAYNCDFSGYF